MKTFYVYYSALGKEEAFKAPSFDVTSKWVRFRKGKTVSAVIAASDVMRIAETKYSPYDIESPPVNMAMIAEYLVSRGVSAPALEVYRTAAN